MERGERRSAPRGLSSAEAARRLHDLGPPEPPSSRSVAASSPATSSPSSTRSSAPSSSCILSLGLFADALFGLIAVVNSAIGIRQELKAKETLDQLALLVAPRAKAVRDGELVELRAEEVVPGDLDPGRARRPAGRRRRRGLDPRGLTIDESILTGESDGVRKHDGDRVLSGAFCLAGSGYYEVDAVREDSHAEKVAGEARALPPPARRRSSSRSTGS